MLKIRRPLGRLIFNMGIAIPGKTVFLIETAPCSFWKIMITSSNGNIFSVTGPLWGEPQVTGGSPHKGQWQGALKVSFFLYIFARTNGWANNPEAGDLRCHHAHYDISVIVQFNSLWASDTICWGNLSTLVQVMACCLMTPSHHLNQCYIIVCVMLCLLGGGNVISHPASILFV